MTDYPSIEILHAPPGKPLISHRMSGSASEGIAESVNYIGDGLRDAFDPYKVLETVGEYT